MAVFINTREAQKREIKEAIKIVLKGTSKEKPMTVTAITEELRNVLPYTVTPQRVTAFVTRMAGGGCYCGKREKVILGYAEGFYYLLPEVSD